MNGDFEDGSVNANVEVRLLDFAEARRDFAHPGSDAGRDET